jgi:anthraniloyl-CoA monooxygenase
MKIVVLGGGPAGLYFALLMKKADPSHQVTVLERNSPDATFGWGVVFSDQTLGNFKSADPETFQEISDNFARWDDIDTHYKGRTITSTGHGFAGISRVKLLDILQRRALSLGVDLRFRCGVRDDSDLPELGLGDADLIVAADGVNSAIRRKYAEVFQPDLEVSSSRYIWLGTTQRFESFKSIFVETEHGVFQVHAYRFSDQHSTFIVECDELSWRNAGLDRMDIDATLAFCEALFGPWLDGHRLLSNIPPQQRAAPWMSFNRVRCARWWHGNIALMGDAAHTAHFSIGSGTKLAVEDAIALARILGEQRRPDLPAALAAYERERRNEALRLQTAAKNSMEWFENVRRYVRLEPEQFVYSLLTRSQRVSHENLRLRDRAFIDEVERWFAGRAAGREVDGPAHELSKIPPPMFTPFTLRGMTVENRVVVAPMGLYSAVEGTPDDLELVHLGARALGGAGLVLTGMTAVSPEARITPGCAGMYTDEHVDAWRRVTRFVHGSTRAKIGLQLGHAGARGSTRTVREGPDAPWERGGPPLEEGGWPLIAASAPPFRPGLPAPREIREMTRADMDRVRDDFVQAARRALAAEFDLLEIHCAHGHLLSGFLTPLLNRRTDEYGGPLGNRLRFPLEVFSAVRAVWPEDRPISVLLSATDWVEGGLDGADAVEIARAFRLAGTDVIHVSTGGTSPDARPAQGRMYQTPFSDRIRNEAGVPTITAGNITDPDQVSSILAAGRADLCALGRPHLADPQWTLRAAAQLGYSGQPWPVQYLAGKAQLVPERQR